MPHTDQRVRALFLAETPLVSRPRDASSHANEMRARPPAQVHEKAAAMFKTLRAFSGLPLVLACFLMAPLCTQFASSDSVRRASHELRPATAEPRAPAARMNLGNRTISRPTAAHVAAA